MLARRYSPACGPGRRRRQSGFNILELLVVLALLGIVAVIFLPLVNSTVRKAKLEGTARSLMQTLSRARSEAIRRGVPVVVEVDLATQELSAFADVDALTLPTPNYTFDPDPLAPFGTADFEVASYTLGGGSSPQSEVLFWGIEDAAPGGADAVRDFSEGAREVIIFEKDGSVRDPGSLRIGMGPHPAASQKTSHGHNFLEIAVTIAASGRTELRKWVVANDRYEAKSSGASGSNWEWY